MEYAVLTDEGVWEVAKMMMRMVFARFYLG